MRPEIHEGEPLVQYPRRRAINQIVLHETVTWSADDAVRVLKRRGPQPQGLGVHYIVDREHAGRITQHVPVALATSHGGGARNHASIGIDIVNRYYGHHAPGNRRVIDAVWAHKGRYILPERTQLEALWQLVDWLCAEYQIPREFPGVIKGRFRWGRIAGKFGTALGVGRWRSSRPGIIAHHRWAHADALFPEHYCLLRSIGQNPTEAFNQTRIAAQSGKRWTEVG